MMDLRPLPVDLDSSQMQRRVDNRSVFRSQLSTLLYPFKRPSFKTTLSLIQLVSRQELIRLASAHVLTTLWEHFAYTDHSISNYSPKLWMRWPACTPYWLQYSSATRTNSMFKLAVKVWWSECDTCYLLMPQNTLRIPTIEFSKHWVSVCTDNSHTYHMAISSVCICSSLPGTTQESVL